MSTSPNDDRHDFGSGSLTASVLSLGAELIALKNGDTDLLWNGGPAWPKHSPILFPIVGSLPNDGVTLAGEPLHLERHGFARTCQFRWIARDDDGCTLELVDDAQTRAVFPAAFKLRVVYLIENGTLRVSYHLHNPSRDSTLHASLGAHPAFAWPQKPGTPKENYRLVFEYDEPLPIRRINADGLLLHDKVHTPIRENGLALKDSLFEADAIIIDRPESTSVDMIASDGHGIRVMWGGFRELGIWMKPGANFLCIEPWAGYTAPAGFIGDFAEKPGLLHLKPGENWTAFWAVRSL